MSGEARLVNDLDLNVGDFCRNTSGYSKRQLVQKNKRSK